MIANKKTKNMIKKYLEAFEKHNMLFISFFSSLFLLIVFLTLQYFNFKALKLDVKWIILCGIPLLIGLFIGGYIKTFKGFGIELESSLKEPIPKSVILPVSQIDITTPGIEKKSTHFLHNTSRQELNKIIRLRFTLNKLNYYINEDVHEYLRVLHNLKFIEIVNAKNEFQYLLSISKLKRNNNLNVERISHFIEAIENGQLDQFSFDAVTEYILVDDSILDAYITISRSSQSKILNLNEQILPVLNNNKIMIGIITKQNLEEKISEVVIKNIDNTK
jgi:hypothetical protein